MQRWDVVMVCHLLYVVVVTPFDVALLELDWNWLYAVNRVIDALFLCDLALNFVLMVKEESPEVGLAVIAVAGHRRIAFRYLRSRFTVDVLNMMPYDTRNSFAWSASRAS